ncbi:hypothetical protein F7P69_09440 [Cellulosimicrobium funkei]|nr:hypothetical protein [Cellulosimicrobium funkei]
MMTLAAAGLALTACSVQGPQASSDAAPGTENTSADAEYVQATEDGPARNVPEPERPDAITQQDENGARAALEYWWAAYRHLELTGDGQHLEAASGSGCSSCGATRRYWTELYDQDHWSTGSERTAEDITVELSGQGTDATLSFVVDQQDYDVWMSTGRVLNPDSRNFAPLQDWRAKARYTDEGHWMVYDLWMLYGEREDGGPDKEPEPEASEETEA